MFIFSKHSLVVVGTILLCAVLLISTPNHVEALTITQTGDTGISAQVGTLPILTTGGGSYGNIQSGVRFSGFAYPRATVTVMKNLTEVSRVVADVNGAFSVIVPEESWQLFTLFATDTSGRKSTLLNFPIVFYSGALTDINGIRFAPTIISDKLSVKQSDYLTILGGALTRIPMEILFDGNESKSYTPVVTSDGEYSMTFPVQLSQGEYLVKARYVDDTRSSRVLRVIVGTANMLRSEATSNKPGDCNFDQNVNLVDFSILAYWYNKQNPPVCVDTNRDKKIDLIDFSILAFYWNG